MKTRTNKRICTSALLTVATLWPSLAPVGSLAADSSPPVILQWFENSWKTMEKRAPDVFMAGYGSVWTPPPGRSLNTAAGGGIGYDIYDRFDLGKARDQTLYGTERGYKTMIKEMQKSGGSVYVDFVHHHVGSFDSVPVPPGAPTVQTRNDYPGFVLSTPSLDPNYLDGDTYQATTQASSGNAAFEYQYRLANLITINFTSSNTQVWVRNPVPGMANNVPQSSANWAVPTSVLDSSGNVVNSGILRQANTPSEDNRRFYPDLQGTPRTIVDHGVSYTVYDFNSANPSAGDPTAENPAGYMMRYAQWLVQDVGIDGLRIDAARHVPLGASGDAYNPTQVNIPELIDRAVAGASKRTNLDGSQRSVFQFQEVFNGDSNFLQNFIRKSAPSGDTTNPNRDVLDFPMWFAMRDNLSSNGSQNNWYNIRNSSQDNRDDGLAHNGSQSIHFVNNHDEGGVALSNVAHAWTLMQPGNAYVFFKGDEFKRPGNTTFFLKDGRGDALGGQYGTTVTRLIDIRNSYGRGNFAERYIDGGGSGGFSNVYAFERVGSCIVGLSSDTSGSGVTSFDQRDMYCAFAPGTRLIELTGNAADAQVDPLSQIPELVVVQNTDNASLGSGKLTMRIPRNQNVQGFTHNKGYVIYGLPKPVGTLGVSNVSQTLAAQAQSASDNSTGRLTAIDVITANSFNLSLNTSNVTLSDGFHDSYADGDRALFKVNEGIDLNGNGVVDNTNSNFAFSTVYGFENFQTTNQPGYYQASGNGSYSQSINTTLLPEGYNYITVRAWRHQGATEQEVFTDFRKVIYVDRLKPQSAVAGSAQYGALDTTRDFQATSLDKTADSVHVLLDLPASLNDAQILALLTSGNHAEQIDRDLFSLINTNTTDGNHVMTVVTFETTGNYNIQRFPGQRTITSAGLGFGDLNHDNTYQPSDISTFGTILSCNNTQFDSAADVTGDGLVDNNDLTGLRANMLTADGATQGSYQSLYNSRINVIAAWNVDANGTWSTMNDWTTVSPNSTTATAAFSSAITAPRTITLDTPATLTSLSFRNVNKYTIAGTSTLTMTGATTAQVLLDNGSHEITAPLVLAQNTSFSINTAGTLKVSNLQSTTRTLTKSGTGTLEVNKLVAGGATISAGKLTILAGTVPATSANELGTLSITGSGQLDLTNNALIVRSSDITSAARNGLWQKIIAGQNGVDGNGFANWDGPGIVSSSARSNNIGLSINLYAVGIISNHDLDSFYQYNATNGGWLNGAVTNIGVDDILIRYTYNGDSNLDGSITIADYVAIDSTYGGTAINRGWASGDFNNDGSIGIEDYVAIDTAYAFQAGSLSQLLLNQRLVQFGPAYVAEIQSIVAGFSAVPEPATLGLAMIGAVGLLARRRRRD